MDTALSGHEVTITLDEIKVENAEHPASYQDVAREETIRLLAENGDRLREKIAALSDEELARNAFHRGAGREMTVAALPSSASARSPATWPRFGRRWT